MWIRIYLYLMFGVSIVGFVYRLSRLSIQQDWPYTVKYSRYGLALTIAIYAGFAIWEALLLWGTR